MATNSKIKKALLDKLDVTPQRLSQLAKARKQEFPMSTELAVYTIAFENGIDVARELDADDRREVQRLVSLLRSNGSPPPAPKKRESASTKRPVPRPVVVKIAAFDAGHVPGMTAAHAKEAKMMAERIYPRLYLFESSARDIITRVLKDAFGDNWWSEVVMPKVRAKAQGRKDDEAKDPWHGKRGAALIDYLDLTDLPKIVTAPKAWPHFEKFFNRKSWFEELVNELNVSRRVAAHMNPLEEDDAKNVEAAFTKWVKVLRAKSNLIP